MMKVIPYESANMFSSTISGYRPGHLPSDHFPTIFDLNHRKPVLDLACFPKQQRNHEMSLEGILNPTTPRKSRLPAGSGELLSPPSGRTDFGRQGATTPFQSRDGSPESQTINFPPFEHLDHHSEHLALKFNVQPLGRIRQTPRSIPYNSDKRPLKGLAGLTKLDVYEYKFTVPGETKEWKVHWDYKEGWVQIAPFFKSQRYAKTAPGKMRDANRGLKDVCHSVTGGAIDFQGYWMKYNSAREMATRFCFNIAPALIPIFGPNFPSDCIRPDEPGYGDMKVNPMTIQADVRAAEAAHRRLKAENGAATSSNSPTPYMDEDLKLPAIRSTVWAQSTRDETPFPDSRPGPGGYMTTPRETPQCTPQSVVESHRHPRLPAENTLSADHTFSRQNTRSTRSWEADPNAIVCQLDRQQVQRPSRGPFPFGRSRVEIDHGICRYPTFSTDNIDGGIATTEESEREVVKAATILLGARDAGYTLEEYDVAHTLAMMRDSGSRSRF